MTTARTTRRSRQRGGALIESAFIFVTLAMMIIGIFDFGQFLFIHQALVERARSAVRWSAVNDPSDTVALKNKVLYDQATAPSGNAPTYFNLTPSNVQVMHTGSLTDDHRILVRIVNYSYPTVSPFLFGSRTTPEIRVSYSLGMFN